MPDHIVIKKAGKFEIVPSDADIARAQSKMDTGKVNNMPDEELRAILGRILIRLEALERRGK